MGNRVLFAPVCAFDKHLGGVSVLLFRESRAGQRILGGRITRKIIPQNYYGH